MSSIQDLHNEVNEKRKQIRQLEKLLRRKEDEAVETAKYVQELEQEVASKQTQLLEEKRQHAETKMQLMATRKDGNELKYLVKYHKDKGSEMSDEADGLLATASDTLKTVDELHTKLERKRGIEERNWNNSQRFRTEFRKSMDDLIQLVDKLREGHALTVKHIRNISDIRSTDREKLLDKFSSSLKMFGSSFEETDRESYNRLANLMNAVASIVDSVNSEIKDSTDNCHRSLSQRIEKIAEGIAGLKSELARISGESIAIKSYATVELNSLRAEVVADSTRNAKIMDQITASLTKVKDTYSHCIEQNLNIFADYKANQGSYQRCFQQNLADMLTTIDQLKANAVALQDTSNSGAMAGENAFETVVSSMEAMRQDLGPVFEDICAKMEETKLMNIKTNQKLCSFDKQTGFGSLKAVDEKTEKKVQSLEAHLTEALTEHRSSISNIQNRVVSRTQEFMDECNTFANQSRAQLADGTAKMEFLKESCSKEVQDICEREAMNSAVILKTVNEQCDIVNEGSKELNVLLQKTAGNMDEFWEETFLIDTPSGGTPMRRRFELPATLTKASPHSRVMSRYRAVSREIESALNDCTTSAGTDAGDRSWSDNYFNNLPVPDFKDHSRCETIREDSEDDTSNKENLEGTRNQ